MGDKKSKSGKQRKSGKLPKKIAGVKIPKELRKSGEALIATAASPVGREMLMTGIAAMLAKAAMRMQTPPRPTGPAAPPPPRSPAAPDATPFDPEAAGAQMARRVFEAIGIVADKITQPPADPPVRH